MGKPWPEMVLHDHCSAAMPNTTWLWSPFQLRLFPSPQILGLLLASLSFFKPWDAENRFVRCNSPSNMSRTTKQTNTTETHAKNSEAEKARSNTFHQATRPPTCSNTSKCRARERRIWPSAEAEARRLPGRDDVKTSLCLQGPVPFAMDLQGAHHPTKPEPRPLSERPHSFLYGPPKGTSPR